MRIMDVVFFINVVLLGLLSVHEAHAQGGGGGCMQDLAKNEDFMRCSQGFAEIILQMQQSAPTEPADTTALFVAFCSPEGRSVLKCVMDFVFECPEIQTMMAGSAEMGMDFTEIVKQGGIDVFCEMTTSGCGPLLEVCKAKMNHVELTGLNDDMKPLNNTPYSLILVQIDVICGPMNEILTCIINAMDQCPKSARFMEQLLANMSKEFEKHGGPRMPSYEEEKKYILGTCPKLPEDFKSKQQCMMQSVSKQEFEECYTNVTDHKDTDCDIYFRGKDCVMEHVGKDCGKSYAEVIVHASPYFSLEIPSNCEKSVNRVNRIQASILTMIGAGFLVYLGF